MIRYAMKNINILNCLLALAVAAGVQEVVVPFLDLNIQPSLPAVTKAAVEQEGSESISPPVKPFADYVMVSEQNLFHRERRIPEEKKEERPATMVVQPPELILYGTLITDDLSIAFIEDKKNPYTTPGRGKRQIQLKKGESVAGYVLKEIETDRIVLVKGDEKLVVMLADKDKTRSGESLALPPSRPVTGALPAPSLPPAARVSSSPRAAPSRSAPATRGAAGVTIPRAPLIRRSR